MAKVIRFHVPEKFHPKVKWVPPAQRGKVIKFQQVVTNKPMPASIGFIGY